jgi:hypothetical protein
MTINTAYSAKDSNVEVTITATLTEVPGVRSITINPGENGTFESGDLASDYDEITATGVAGGAAITFSGTWDPLDSTQQWLHAAFNAGDTLITGNCTVSSSGVDVGWTGFLTKWEVKSEFKGGWMFDAEIKCNERITLNEDDPA